MDLREIGCLGLDWLHLAQDKNQWQAAVIMVMNLWIPHQPGVIPVNVLIFGNEETGCSTMTLD